MLPVPLLLLRVAGSTSVGGEGAAQRQPKLLTNTSPIPGPVAISTADTLVGSQRIDTLPTAARAGIHALVDICQETHSFQAPKGEKCSLLQDVPASWILRLPLRGTVMPKRK